jgi:hypothetical protein
MIVNDCVICKQLPKDLFFSYRRRGIFSYSGYFSLLVFLNETIMREKANTGIRNRHDFTVRRFHLLLIPER